MEKNHHKLLVFVFLFSLFQACATQKKLTYLALGDSYTIGESIKPSERWPAQLVEALRDSGITISDLKIIAQTGWTTTDLRNAIQESQLNAPYELVSLLIGVNDQYQNRDIKKYPQRFQWLLEKAIQLAGGKVNHVFVVSIPDYSVTPYGQKREPIMISEEIARYNTINQQISNRLGVTFINITPISEHAENNVALIADDGLHPSGKMYKLWVEQIMQKMLPNIKEWESHAESYETE